MCIGDAMIDSETLNSLSPTAAAEYARLEAEYAELEKHPDASGTKAKRSALNKKLAENRRQRFQMVNAARFLRAVLSGTKTEPK